MSPVRLSLGSDAFRAQMTSDVCTGEGIRHELILSGDPHSLAYPQSHYMVVAESDVDAVKQVIHDHFPEMLSPTQDAPAATSTPLWQRLLMVGGVVSPIAALIYAWVNDLL